MIAEKDYRKSNKSFQIKIMIPIMVETTVVVNPTLKKSQKSHMNVFLRKFQNNHIRH